MTTEQNLRLAIDAKYKGYDTRKLHESDIYQTFLYTYAFNNAEAGRMPSALIIYPADLPATHPTRLHIRDSRGSTQARLYALGIEIPATLDDLFANTTKASVAVTDVIRHLLE